MLFIISFEFLFHPEMKETHAGRKKYVHCMIESFNGMLS